MHPSLSHWNWCSPHEAGEGEEKEREREKGKKRERERGKKVGEVWKEEGRGKEGKEEDIVLLECITINEFPDNRK